MCQVLKWVLEVQMGTEIWPLCSWDLQSIVTKSFEMDVYPVLAENPLLTDLVKDEFLTIPLNFLKRQEARTQCRWPPAALDTHAHCPKVYLRAHSTTPESLRQALLLRSCVLAF